MHSREITSSNMQRREFVKSAGAAAILMSPAAESLFAATENTGLKEQSGNPAESGIARKAEAVHLSPSETHRHLMSRMTPELRYDGGDVREWRKKLLLKLRQLLGAMPKSRCVTVTSSFRANRLRMA